MRILSALLLAGLALWMAYNEAATSLHAWHPLYTDPQFNSDQLWPNLEVGGNQRITYGACGGPLTQPCP